MQLQDIVGREIPPLPWAEGEKIPWNDPEFSVRMLREHLSQDHDLASRRQPMVDRHVSWIHQSCLQGRPARVLDLACGPGLYSQALTGLGHACVGIDFSPASIEYARSQAAAAELEIEYIEGDLRAVPFGADFDLAMFIYGEINVFQKPDARALLRRAYDALRTGGSLLIEPQALAAIRGGANRAASWQTVTSGLFSPDPHLLLEEHFWHAQENAATTRYFMVDAATGAVERYAFTTQAYTDGELDQLLGDMGFTEIERLPSLAGSEEHRHPGLFVLRAVKR